MQNTGKWLQTQKRSEVGIWEPKQPKVGLAGWPLNFMLLYSSLHLCSLLIQNCEGSHSVLFLIFYSVKRKSRWPPNSKMSVHNIIDSYQLSTGSALKKYIYFSDDQFLIFRICQQCIWNDVEAENQIEFSSIQFNSDICTRQLMNIKLERTAKKKKL